MQVLTPAQAEALSLVAEEAAEVIKAIHKIFRHGLVATDHTYKTPVVYDNLSDLQAEIGHLAVALIIAENEGVVLEELTEASARHKLKTIQPYLHHCIAPPWSDA